MADQRRKARAERERLAAERAAAEKERAARDAAERARRDRRTSAWRRARLWQHGPAFRRHRETWGGVAIVCLLILLVAYLLTKSWDVVIGTALVLLIASPVLLTFVFDRKRP